MKEDKLVNRIDRFNQHAFIQVLQQTMIILFPVALIGSFTWVISDNLLASNGFLAEILRIQQWLPQWRFFHYLFRDATTIMIGWLSTYAAFVSAILTTQEYKRVNWMAGLCGIVSYVLIFYHTVRGSQMLEIRYFSAGWFIIGVLIGYLVGLIFVKWGQPFRLRDLSVNRGKGLNVILSNLRPFLLVVVGAFILHLLYAIWRAFNLDAMTVQTISSMIGNNSNYLLNIFLSLINTILVWLGFAEPLALTAGAYSNEASNNLVYVLVHRTFANVPYPFTPSALYYGYANFGGVGVTIALVIGILWVGNKSNQQRIAGLSIFPAIFNTGLPILFGSRVFLNIIYLVPFVVLPIVNMLLASLLILLKIIPPVVYPVPSGTPGVLVPFIVTGGNWLVLLVTVLLVILDVIVYIPFIKLALRVDERMRKERHDAH